MYVNVLWTNGKGYIRKACSTEIGFIIVNDFIIGMHFPLIGFFLFFNKKYLRQYNSSDDNDNSEEWSIRVKDDIREKK